MKEETKIKKQAVKTSSPKKVQRKTISVGVWRNIALILLGIFVLNRLFSITVSPKFDIFGIMAARYAQTPDEPAEVDITEIQKEVIPEEGVELPVKWGEIGKKMVEDGVIDEQKFLELFQNGLNEDEMKMLSGIWDDKVVMNEGNSRFLLDILWAFGLANKNDILENGEMTDEKYGGDASKFASTGGWSLSRGNVMNHYSAHPYVVLTKEQQELVDRVSSGIYRPCCGNSTHFPDCNHGMAMLGLLELMVANNVSEEEMYDVALKVNTLWFPQTYIDLATYFKEQGQDWDQVDSKVALSANYSSGQGYQATRQKIESLPKPQQGGGGCGV